MRYLAKKRSKIKKNELVDKMGKDEIKEKRTNKQHNYERVDLRGVIRKSNDSTFILLYTYLHHEHHFSYIFSIKKKKKYCNALKLKQKLLQ